MIYKNAIITDTGIVIDPDDETDIVKHDKFYEIRIDGKVFYCERIYPMQTRIKQSYI